MEKQTFSLGGKLNPAAKYGAVGALHIYIAEGKTIHIKELSGTSEYIGHIDYELRYNEEGTGLMRVENLETNEAKEFTFTYVNAISKDHFIVQNGDVDILSITFE
ncbi:MAG: hypothetical protein J5717_11605 [Lachnospiraceae bacterium]|nr:hypothetical protein [Lachnospiraceae bacterium]